MAKVKRQYTRWIFECRYDNGSILIGYIYNKNEGVLADAIRLSVFKKDHECFSVNCRIDEAVAIAAGLNKVVTQILVGQLPQPTKDSGYCKKCITDISNHMKGAKNG